MIISMRRMRKRKDTYTIFSSGSEVLKLDKIVLDVEGKVDLSSLVYYGEQVLDEVIEKIFKFYPEIKGFRISKRYLKESGVIIASIGIKKEKYEPNYLFDEFSFLR